MSLLVLALISLGLAAVLVLLIHRRREEEAAAAAPRGPVDPDDLVSALVVELAVTPEVLKHRRRERPATTEPAAPATATATPPAAAVPDPSPAPAPEAPSAPEVWAERRSPYASGSAGRHRIALPDDDSDFDIRWRPQEESLGSANGATSPLARSTQVAATGRIEVGDDEDDVTWRSGGTQP